MGTSTSPAPCSLAGEKTLASERGELWLPSRGRSRISSAVMLSPPRPWVKDRSGEKHLEGNDSLAACCLPCSWTTADRTPCGFVCFLDPMIIFVIRMGWGWGGVGWCGVGIIPNVSRATLHDLHLHLMLRYMIVVYIDR